MRHGARRTRQRWRRGSRLGTTVAGRRGRAKAAALISIPACFAANSARAQDDDGFCRNGMFGEENRDFGVAVVGGKERLHFLEDMNGCPNETASCRMRSYVIAGDRLVTGREKGDYVCAYYP